MNLQSPLVSLNEPPTLPVDSILIKKRVFNKMGFWLSSAMLTSHGVLPMMEIRFLTPVSNDVTQIGCTFDPMKHIIRPGSKDFLMEIWQQTLNGSKNRRIWSSTTATNKNNNITSLPNNSRCPGPCRSVSYCRRKWQESSATVLYYIHQSLNRFEQTACGQIFPSPISNKIPIPSTQETNLP